MFCKRTYYEKILKIHHKMLKKLFLIPIKLIQSSLTQQRNSNSSTTSIYAGYQNFKKLLQMTVQHLCNPISFLKIYPMRCTVDLN